MIGVGEQLRQSMRHWTTGVAIVTSRYAGIQHGMTVNSFTSVSLDPPLVTVTLAHQTRTRHLVQQSYRFGVTILASGQQAIADRFSGRGSEDSDRFAGLELFELAGGVPLLKIGLAFVDCQVIHQHELENSTLFIGQVLAAEVGLPDDPLVYYQRSYHRLNK